MPAPRWHLAAALIAAAVVAGSAEAQRFGRGGPDAAPPEPAPRTANGKVSLHGSVSGTAARHGVWAPGPVGGAIADPEFVPFQPWARALFDARVIHRLEPHARCKASGAARQFLTPYGVEFVEVEALNMLYIFDIGGPHTFRTVYLDGRGHPSDPSPANYGHSIGWWEGDTLVIDTVGYNEDFWFGRQGLPHTDALHTVERLTRVNAERIDYAITIDDPGAYTAAYTAEFTLTLRAEDELFEYVCQQVNYAHELMVGTQHSRTIDRSSPIVP